MRIGRRGQHTASAPVQPSLFFSVVLGGRLQNPSSGGCPPARLPPQPATPPHGSASPPPPVRLCFSALPFLSSGKRPKRRRRRRRRKRRAGRGGRRPRGPRGSPSWSRSPRSGKRRRTRTTCPRRPVCQPGVVGVQRINDSFGSCCSFLQTRISRTSSWGKMKGGSSRCVRPPCHTIIFQKFSA